MGSLLVALVDTIACTHVITHGMWPHKITQVHNNTALMLAAQGNATSVAMQLIGAGVDVNAVNVVRLFLVCSF